ncbi:hypothetical protein B0J17DRAFT_722831 [Rhizoctonia solani]|nr:hypothetical protein B0J17DRAFT_722831 [Rhizoctonia solani]
MSCARDATKGEEAKKQIFESTGNLEVDADILGYRKFASVRAFLSRWEERGSKRVDILIKKAATFTSTVAIIGDRYE